MLRAHSAPRLTSTLAIVLCAVATASASAQQAPRLPIVTPAQAGDITLTPHRAVYDLKLRNIRTGSSVTNVAGRMVYELTGNACDGFTQTSRFVLEIATQENGASVTDVRSTTFEDAKSEKFRFNTTTVRDGKGGDISSGEVVRGPDGLNVELTRPAKASKAFAQAYYPVQHSFALLKAARSGTQRLVGDLYDGSDNGQKAYDTTANIGAVRPAGTNKRLPVVKGSEKLDTHRAWPIAISYFDLMKGQSDSVPVYEMAFLFYDNGVSRNLVIDYGEYAIAGDITALEYLDPAPGAPPCDPAKVR